MTSKYAQGRRVEWHAKHQLEGLGYKVPRASGSKGLFDLIAFNKEQVRFIQVKSTRDKKRKYQKEIDEISSVRLPVNAHKELWVWLHGVGWLEFLQVKDFGCYYSKERVEDGVRQA